MNTVDKISTVFEMFPWKHFFITIELIVIVFLLLSLVNHRKVRLWFRKFQLSFVSGTSSIAILFSFICVVFSTFFFITWISNVQIFNSIENYFINLALIALFSLTFGILSFLIHLTNLNAYITENSIKSDSQTSSQLEKLERVQILKEEAAFFKMLLTNLKDGSELIYLGSVKNGNLDFIQKAISQNTFEKEAQPETFAVRIYKISKSEDYFIQTKMLVPAGPGGAFKTAYLNQFLHDRRLILLTSRSFFSPFFNFKSAVKNRSEDEKEFNGILKIIESQILDTEEVLIPAQIEFSSASMRNIGSFLFAYVLDFFGLNQTYLVPNSKLAKANHLLFGFYRFLMHGTFISLLIKDIANL